MVNNVTQYKPGQFVKVDAPGKYRMAFTKGTVENVLSRPIDACKKCALSGKCCLSGSVLFRNNKNCVETLGWGGYLVKVKQKTQK